MSYIVSPKTTNLIDGSLSGTPEVLATVNQKSVISHGLANFWGKSKKTHKLSRLDCDVR